EDADQHLAWEVVDGPRHDVQREGRGATHRVHVRQRVRGYDPPPVVRVVHDRREEVEGLDDRATVAERIHGRVVAGVTGDEHRGGHRGTPEPAKDLRQFSGPDLARTSRAVTQL